MYVNQRVLVGGEICFYVEPVRYGKDKGSYGVIGCDKLYKVNVDGLAATRAHYVWVHIPSRGYAMSVHKDNVEALPGGQL